MTKTVLITGAGPTGVTGRAIKEYLENAYSILAPSSSELDLTNDEVVRDYFDNHQIDFVIHCATFRSNISQTTHLVNDELESNLRMYFNLATQSEKFQKMVYLGSGAEYDKSRSIVNVSENQFGECVPKDKYGFGKYIMNQYCRSSKNIYNLRMFGTLNKYERYTKNVVCNLCAKAIMGMPLNLKQNCRFSWVDIRDVSMAISYIFNYDIKRFDYNIAIEQSYTLYEIAKLICHLAQINERITFEKEGMNKEYTCETTCSRRDIPIRMTSISDSILDIYQYYLSIKDSIQMSSIDSRWN